MINVNKNMDEGWWDEELFQSRANKNTTEFEVGNDVNEVLFRSFNFYNKRNNSVSNWHKQSKMEKEIKKPAFE